MKLTKPINKRYCHFKIAFLFSLLLAGNFFSSRIAAQTFGVTINQATAQADPTTTMPAAFKVVFASAINPVTFDASDIILSGTATNKSVVAITEIAPNNGTTFQVTVTATGQGTIIPTIIATSCNYVFATVATTVLDIARDASGNLFTASSVGINKITPSGVTTLISGSVGCSSITVDASGNVYSAKSSGGGIQKVAAGASTATNFVSTVFAPRGIVTDAAGNIYTANATSNNVTKITPAGVATVLGTTGTSPQDVVIDASGNVYTPNQTTNNVSKITAAGVSTILGTTGTGPVAIAIDASGNIYTANGTANNVSKITSAGVSTVLGSLGTGASPSDLVLDASGNVYVANNGSSGTSLFTISKITAAGVVSALCNISTRPRALVLDNSNALYVGNSNNASIHKVAISGNAIEILNLLGNGNAASTSTDNQVTYAPPNFSFDCNNASTIVIEGFNANANAGQSGSVNMSLTGALDGVAVFTFSGNGFTSTPYTTTLTAGQTTVSLPFTYDGLGFAGTRTLTIKSVQAIGTDSCTKNVTIDPIAGGANFSFLCNAFGNGITGNLIANGVPGQTGTFVIGVTNPGGSPALRHLILSGPGISGSLVTSLSPDGPFGTNYISIPFTYDGTGSPGSISITVSSPQSGSGSGSSCVKSGTLNSPPASFVFDCGTASTSSTFYANGSNQAGSITIPMTSASAGPATFSVAGTGFSGSLSTTLTAGQTTVNIPIIFLGTGAAGTRTLIITSAQATGTCNMSVTVNPPPVATFTFDCLTASMSGAFVANGMNPQTANLTLPILSATAGTASFLISGSGISGALNTTLTASQASVIVPIMYDGTGSAGSVILTITSPEGSGTCTQTISISTELNVTINQASTQVDPVCTLPVKFTVTFSQPINVSTFTTSKISTIGSTAPGVSIDSIKEVSPNDGTTFSVFASASGIGTIVASIPTGPMSFSITSTAFGTNGGSASSTHNPVDIFIDASGNVYTANQGSGTAGSITKRTPLGVFSTIQLTVAAQSIVVDATGNMYVTSINPNTIITKVTPAGVQSTLATITPTSELAIDPSGNIYTIVSNGDIKKITSSGVVSTVGTFLANTWGDLLYLDAAQNFYSISGSGAIGKVSSAGGTGILFASTGSDGTSTMDKFGSIYSCKLSTGVITKTTLAGVSTTFATTPGFSNAPTRITIDGFGNLYGSTGAGPIYFISNTGVVTTIGSNTNSPLGIAADASGKVFMCNYFSSNLTIISPTVNGIMSISGVSNNVSSSTDNSITYSNTCNASFTFNCGSASASGTFIANGTTGQAGTLTIPITGATAGSASLTVAGTGFSGSLSTTLTAGQTSVSIPITFDGTGSASTVSLTITSAQGTGSCLTNVTVSGVPDLITSVGQPITPLIVGQPSDIPVTVSNIGNGPAPGVITTLFTLPPGTSAPPTFTSNGSTCSTSFPTVTCTNAGPIAAGGNIVINIPTTPDNTLLGTTPTFNATTTPLPGETATGNNPSSPTTASTPVGAPSVLSVTINKAASQVDPTTIAAIHFTAVFSQAINPSTFTSSDISMSGTACIATGPTLTTTDNITWDIFVEAGCDGTIIESIAANAVSTVSGTGNAASTSTDNSVLYDITPPSIYEVTPVPALTNNPTPQYTFNSTEMGTLHFFGDCSSSTTNAIAGNNTVTFNTLTEGLHVCALQVTDSLGNLGNVMIISSFLVDLTGPSITINQSASQADPTALNPMSFTAIFSEEINPLSFNASDITLGGTSSATAGTPTTSDNITWTIPVSATTAGTVIASININKVTDVAGNNNLASTSTDQVITFIINSSFAFNCGSATSTGTFTANGTSGQSGTVIIPITGATAGTANFIVSGAGFTGSLSTILTSAQTSVSVPVTYNGAGAAGSQTLTVTSAQASGTCSVIVSLLAGSSDIDNDGFPDSTDYCPTIAGVAPYGCPSGNIGQNFNPFVTQALIGPAPLYNVISNGTGQISMIIGNSGDDALPLIVGQEMHVNITLSNGIPDNANPLAALAGTYASHFTWQYDSLTKTYSGIQNQTIGDALNGGVGAITIDYKVTANSTSALPQNGFSCTITPPSYTFISNTQFDDFGSSYTWTIPKLNPNPDFIVVIPGSPSGGDLSTNDQLIPGTTYSNPPVNTNNPSSCSPVVASNGTFTFTCTTPGEYDFLIPVCEPSPSTLCFDVPLQITVVSPPTSTSAPIANPDVLTTIAGSPLTTSVTSNDVCMNGATCTLSNPTIISGPSISGSTIVVNPNGTITFTPAPGFVGKDSIMYAVCDNQLPISKCDSEWVYITVLPLGSINSTNAGDDFATATFGTTINGNAKTNDTDPEGNTQSITAQTTTLAGKGTLVLTSTGTYTFTPVSGFSGSVDFPYTTCDNGTPVACASATIHILIQQGAPDLTPNITMIPNVMHGITTFNVTVRVTELNSVSTNGLITVRIPKDTRVSFTYNNAATSIGFTAVSNSTWTYVGTNPFFHIFTRSTSITGGSFSTFGFIASFNPANSDGKYSMTSTISSGSGGENKSTNNTDSESADYFHN